MAIKTVDLLGAGANWSMGPLALCEAINNALEVDLYGHPRCQLDVRSPEPEDKWTTFMALFTLKAASP